MPAAAGDLTTLAVVKEAVTMGSSADDDLIQRLITAASKAINRRYQREFAPVTGTPTRRFAIEARLTRVSLAPYDLLSTSGAGVVLYAESTSPQTLVRHTDYDLSPVGASMLGTYLSVEFSSLLVLSGETISRFGYANLDVTGTWGPAAVDVDVDRACAVTVASWVDRGANQISSLSSDGREQFVKTAAAWSIPKAAHNLLQTHERFSYV